MSLAILRFPSFFKAFFWRPFQDLPSQAYVRWYQTSSAVLRATAPVTSSDAGRSDLEDLSGAAQGCLGPKGTDINAPNRNVSDSVSASLRACYATMRTRPEDWPHVTLGLLERPGSLTSVHIWETGHGSIKSLLLRRFKVFEKWIEVREILEKSFSLYNVCIRTDANLQSTRPEHRLPSSTRQSLVLTIQERSERDHRDIGVRCQQYSEYLRYLRYLRYGRYLQRAQDVWTKVIDSPIISEGSPADSLLKPRNRQDAKQKQNKKKLTKVESCLTV